MAGNSASYAEKKQPLSERSTNQQSPIKSPSKIALPPSPMSNYQESYEEAGDTTEALSAYIVKDLTLPKPALFRDISNATAHGQTYISPSDNILSPTTKKLTEVKGRRFATSKKTALYNPSNLFAKADSKAEDSKSC